MNKILLLIMTIFISNYSFCQEIPHLKLLPNGVEPIVVEVDSLDASEIYDRALRWVQETYKNPDKVLKANIPNQKIRIDGYASNAWWYKTLGMQFSYDMEYTLEISFKDGRYRFEYNVGQFHIKNGQKVQYDYQAFFKKSGEIRNSYTDAIPSIEKTINDLSQSFNNYIIGITINQDNDW